jgi:tetratricopeptide (TPR) repeat protein
MPPATKTPSPIAETAATVAAEEISTAHLVTFQPSPGLESAPPTDREALAAAEVRRLVRQKNIRRRRRLIMAAGALAMIGLLLWLGPGFYRSFKVWRATGLALQGEELVRKDKISEAIPDIRSAFMLSPDAPEVLRAMAQILAALNAPDAMTYWNWVLQTKGVTDDDRRAAAECAMRNNLYNEAAVIIQDLVTRDEQDARNELLAARWSNRRGTEAQTIQLATRAVNDDPAYKPAVLFLAIHELDNSYLHQDGVDSLFRLAGADDDFGLSALRQLAVDPGLKPAEIDRLVARLHSHPLAGELERVAALNLEIKLHPDRREALLDQGVADHRTSTPADLAVFAEWLNNHQQAGRVLKLLPRERALSNRDLFTAYLNALSLLNRWADIKTVLTGASVPLDVPLVELYLSRCADEMGDDQTSELHWQKAAASALHNPAQSFHLALYAEKLGQNERAAAVYRTLTQEPVTARAAYQGLLRVSKDKDTRTLRDLLDEIVSRWPADSEMESQDIYLNLLLNERAREMHDRAVRILTGDSNSISHRTNVALACLRLHDPTGALAPYRYVSIDWNTAPVPDLIVYAAVLDANGYVKKAHHLLGSVNRHALRPEARDLIKSIP